jgi:hypothetical protein
VLKKKVLNEKEDRASMMQAFQAAGVPAAQFSDVQDAAARIVNAGVLNKKQAVNIASTQYKKYVDQAKNELDPDVKAAGGPSAFILRMMEQVAKFFNKKAGNGAAEGEKKTAPSQHHKKMKLQSLRDKFIKLRKSAPSQNKLEMMRKIYKDYLALGGKAKDLGIGKTKGQGTKP